MRINEAGLELVKEFEGCLLKAYLCPAGVWTIGYGHTKGVRKGQTCTQAQADAWLREDLRESEQAVGRLVTVKLNGNEFSALVSFVFNVGSGNFRTSTLLSRLNRGDYLSVPDQLARWNKATVRGRKVVLPGLVRRRAAEAALWLRPVRKCPNELMAQAVTL